MVEATGAVPFRSASAGDSEIRLVSAAFTTFGQLNISSDDLGTSSRFRM